MLILSLNAVARGPVQLREEVPVGAPLLAEADLALREPLRVDLEARQVGEGVLVRGDIDANLEAECRRCLTPVTIHIRDTVDMLYEPLSREEEDELGGDVYPLPERGDALDVSSALREQLLLKIPEYVECAENCRGLCPKCGNDLNFAECACGQEERESPWTALKDIKFD